MQPVWSQLALCFGLSAFSLSGCRGASFQGEGKQASLPPPKCPQGVQVNYAASQAGECWKSRRVLNTSAELPKGVDRCTTFNLTSSGCDSLDAVLNTAEAKGYYESHQRETYRGAIAEFLMQKNLSPDAVAVIGCSEGTNAGVFYIQIEGHPASENECSKTVGNTVLSFCIYSSTSSYTSDTNRCVWP